LGGTVELTSCLREMACTVRSNCRYLRAPEGQDTASAPLMAASHDLRSGHNPPLKRGYGCSRRVDISRAVASQLCAPLQQPLIPDWAARPSVGARPTHDWAARHQSGHDPFQDEAAPG
jgi:hypothetical protein